MDICEGNCYLEEAVLSEAVSKQDLIDYKEKVIAADRKELQSFVNEKVFKKRGRRTRPRERLTRSGSDGGNAIVTVSGSLNHAFVFEAFSIHRNLWFLRGPLQRQGFHSDSC